MTDDNSGGIYRVFLASSQTAEIIDDNGTGTSNASHHLTLALVPYIRESSE